jgi:TolA-binding protein
LNISPHKNSGRAHICLRQPSVIFMLRFMKFAAAVIAISTLLCSILSVGAQGLQVDSEEVRRLQGEVADLRDANAESKRRISELNRRIDNLQNSLREANERQISRQGDFVTREDLKKILDQINQVDERRESDRKIILDAFDKLEKSLSSNTSRRPPTVDTPTPPAKIEGTFYPHKVQSGETLSHILEAYNEALQKEGRPRVSYSQVKQANPKLDLNRIRVGQEILLPVPDKK